LFVSALYRREMVAPELWLLGRGAAREIGHCQAVPFWQLEADPGCDTIFCMNRIVLLAVAVSLLSPVLPAANKKISDTHEQARLRASGDVLQEILDIPENIPPELLNKAECVVVIPGT